MRVKVAEPWLISSDWLIMIYSITQITHIGYSRFALPQSWKLAFWINVYIGHVRNMKCGRYKYFWKINKYKHLLLIFHSKHHSWERNMAEFGFFVLGAVIGVPAALGGLGAYVRAKVCKCDGLVILTKSFQTLSSPSSSHCGLFKPRPIPCPCRVPDIHGKICNKKVNTTIANITRLTDYKSSFVLRSVKWWLLRFASRGCWTCATARRRTSASLLPTWWTPPTPSSRRRTPRPRLRGPLV